MQMNFLNLFRKFIQRFKLSGKGRPQRRPLKDYSFVTEKIFPKAARNSINSERTITWIVPPFHAGAGGHTTIFRFVRFLEAKGFTNRLVIMDGAHFGGVRNFKKLLYDSFDRINIPIFMDLAESPVSHMTVATSWLTAYLLRNYQASTKPIYFIQDYEPWFYPHGTDYALAENTYSFGFYGITAGSWLKNIMEKKYKMKCSTFSFSYDGETYFSAEVPIKCPKKIFFYARPTTHRRAFELGLMVLSGVSKAVSGVKIVFAGEDLSDYEIPFEHESLGVLTPQGLAQIYRECSLALILSLSNVSLLPFEVIACGTPIVSNDGAWVEWLLSPEFCSITGLDVENLIREISSLVVDEERLRKLTVRGQEYVRSTSWNHEGERIVEDFEKILNESY